MRRARALVERHLPPRHVERERRAGWRTRLLATLATLAVCVPLTVSATSHRAQALGRGAEAGSWTRSAGAAAMSIGRRLGIGEHPTPAPATTARVATPAAQAPTPTVTHAAAPVAAPPSRARRVDFGVYVDGFPGSTAALDAVERSTGRHLDIVMWYVHWAGPWSAFNAGDVRAVIARGSTPMITWMSDDPTSTSQAEYTPSQVMSGRYDSYIRAWAAGLRDIGHPVLLRFDGEMNGSWAAWSVGVNGNTAQQFVAMWRYVHGIFAATGATNVRWVWSPNIAYPGSTPISQMYPGDAYVDRVGVDGYNWGPHDQWHSWQSFASVFDTTLNQVRALTRRPLMICEVASTETGGDKSAWIRDFFARVVERSDITGFVWFDVAKEADWRIDSSQAALAAFVAGLRSVS